jgi:murein DD-endopeptidase MepM/ murein hydrolase activator NlpD
MDQRRLTFIMVADGDLESRTWTVSYRWLGAGLVAVGLLLAAFVIVVSTWWIVAAQAARVPGLEREVARLEEEQAKVAELARTLAEVEAQYERVRQLLGADGAAAGAREPSLPPLRRNSRERETSAVDPTRIGSWPLSQPGYITRALTSGETRHPGLDIAVAADSYIRAAGSGVVLDAGSDEVYGEFVLIDHGGGLETIYGHASRRFVEKGESVGQNQVIALTGSTGRSTGPHLHFEVRHNGRAVDPLTFVRQP